MKLDASGETIWATNLDNNGEDFMTSVLETSEGDFIVAGSIILAGSASQDLLIAKLSSSGSEQWLYTYELSTSNEKLFALLQAQHSSNVYFAGYSDLISQSQSNVLFGEIDSQGNIVRCKEYAGGASDMVYSMAYSPNGNIVLVGSTTTYGEGSSDILIMEIDLEGSVVSAHALGSADGETARSIDSYNGNLLLGANGFNSTKGASDVLIAKYSTIF